jgi:hypothetical protein
MINPLLNNSITTESVLKKELQKLEMLLLKNDPKGCIKVIQKLNNILEHKPNKYKMYKNLL